MVLRRCPLCQTVKKTIGFIMNCDFHTFILRVLRRCVPCELRRYHLVVLRRQVLDHKFNDFHWFYIKKQNFYGFLEGGVVCGFLEGGFHMTKKVLRMCF